MTFKDWDECLKFFDILTKWPLVILYLALLFKKAIAEKLSGLESVKVKEVEVIFGVLKKAAAESTNPAFIQQLVLRLLPDVTSPGETDAEDNNVSKTKDEVSSETEQLELAKAVKEARE